MEIWNSKPLWYGIGIFVFIVLVVLLCLLNMAKRGGDPEMEEVERKAAAAAKPDDASAGYHPGSLADPRD